MAATDVALSAERHVQGAVLLVTLYAKTSTENAQGLRTALLRGLHALPEPDEHKVAHRVEVFSIFGVRDLDVVQLLLNGRDDRLATGEAGEWLRLKALWEQLAADLADCYTSCYACTLAYHGYWRSEDHHRQTEHQGSSYNHAQEATAARGFAIATELVRQLATPSLGLPAHSHLQHQATCGDLYLLATPTTSQTLPHSIYLSLSDKDKQQDFFKTFLWGRGAFLLPLDAVAHKAMEQYYQAKRKKKEYEHKLGALETQARAVLNDLTAAAQDKQLDKLSKDYAQMVEVLTIFSTLQLSLERQKVNISQLQAGFVGGRVFAYHSESLALAFEDLRLQVQNGARALQFAQMAVSSLETHLEKQQAQRQVSLQNFLAFLAAFFTVPSLIDREVARELLLLVGWLSTEQAEVLWWLLLVQLGAIVLVTLLLRVLWRLGGWLCFRKR